MIEDAFFRIRIDTRKSVIKNKDVRITNNGACYCSALFLAARQCNSALSDQSVIFERKTFDISRDVGCLGCTADQIFTRLLDAESNIFADCVAEQECLLRHKSNIST